MFGLGFAELALILLVVSSQQPLKDPEKSGKGRDTLTG